MENDLGIHNDVTSLYGRVIESVWLDDINQSCLKLVFSDGGLALFDCYGECCSHSYIASIELFDFKGTLLEVEASEVSSDLGLNEIGDHTDVTFYTFKTQYGRMLIDFRNVNNGSYSGHLELRSDHDDSMFSWKLVE